MFQHILVPTDFSAESKRAFDIAKTIVSSEGGVLTLLHVIEIIADTTFDEFKSFYLKLEERAVSHLDEWIDASSGHEFPVEKKIMYGNRVGEIIKFARESKVDLIILSSHKIDVDDPGRGWGTISYKVGILSQCPVMLIK